MAKSGHYCLEARIKHYQTPGPNSVMEATEYNNRAQSNYDRFISDTGSSPSRKVTSVKVQNPFNKSMRVHIRVAKSSTPLFRTYVERTWLLLQPGESKDVALMFEYAYEEDPTWSPDLERYIGKPNDVAICAVAYELDDEAKQKPVTLGGAIVQVVTGRATRIDGLVIDPPTATGRVVRADTGDPVPGGNIILIVKTNEEEEYRTATVHESGFFTVDSSGGWDSVTSLLCAFRRLWRRNE